MNDVLAIVTLVSIAAIVLETVPSLEPFSQLFTAVEYATVFIFTLEYAGRLAIADRPRQYLFSFFGIIDLLAILPSVFRLANLTFLKSVRVLRILRFLRMARLAKLARAHNYRTDLEEHADIYRLNVEIYFFSLLSAIIILGGLMYIFEAPSQQFSSMPAGMLWVTENILGGSITNTVPITTPGKIIALTTRFIGLVLFGLLINVVGSLVNKLLFGSKKI